MRKKINLLQKLELFYREIQPKRKNGEKMRLQTEIFKTRTICIKKSIYKQQLKWNLFLCTGTK